jgi:hypothetical protein
MKDGKEGIGAEGDAAGTKDGKVVKNKGFMMKKIYDAFFSMMVELLKNKKISNNKLMDLTI